MNWFLVEREEFDFSIISMNNVVTRNESQDEPKRQTDKVFGNIHHKWAGITSSKCSWAISGSGSKMNFWGQSRDESENKPKNSRIKSMGIYTIKEPGCHGPLAGYMGSAPVVVGMFRKLKLGSQMPNEYIFTSVLSQY